MLTPEEAGEGTTGTMTGLRAIYGLACEEVMKIRAVCALFPTVSAETADLSGS
jgi:hypothetical protein